MMNTAEVSLDCPGCSESMRVECRGFDESIEVDVCDGCGGTWFDKGELDMLDDSVVVNAEQIEFVRGVASGRHCPRCGGPLTVMSPQHLPELVMETCDTCFGFWLERGRLEEVRELTLRMESGRVSDRHDKRQGLIDMIVPRSPTDWLIYFGTGLVGLLFYRAHLKR